MRYVIGSKGTVTEIKFTNYNFSVDSNELRRGFIIKDIINIDTLSIFGAYKIYKTRSPS